MKNQVINTAVMTAMLFSLFLIAAGSTAAQSAGTTKAAATNGVAAANPQTVNAQQSGPWTVGIDSSRNSVQVNNSEANPLSVRTVSTRKPFQTRVFVTPTGDGFSTVNMPIPAGKRLVIENVSVISRIPVGMLSEANFYTYYDNDGDGVGGIEDITFHRIGLEYQGIFQNIAISTANLKVQVFADERIGTEHYGVGVQARLNGGPVTTAQVQFTFSGYVEDMPTTP